MIQPPHHITSGQKQQKCLTIPSHWTWDFHFEEPDKLEKIT